MEFYEYPLLHYPDLMLAWLKAASDHEASLEDCIVRLKNDLDRADEHPPIEREDLVGRLETAKRRLVKAHLLTPLGGERYRITPRGRKILADHPLGVDDTVLMQFPEFRDYVAHLGSTAPPEDGGSVNFDQGYAAYQEGKTPLDNPYHFDSSSHLSWEHGWFEARAEDQNDKTPA